MKKRCSKPLVALALSGLLLVGAGSVMAGGGGGGMIVFDPTNFTKNTITAAQSIRQTMHLLNQYRLELEKYRRDYALYGKDALVKSDVNRRVEETRALLNELRSLYNGLQNVDGLFQQRMRDYATSNLSLDQWLDRERQLAQQRTGDSRRAFEAETRAIRQVERQRQRVARLQSQIDAPVGVQQSMQTMNQHLNLIAAQNATLTEMLAAKNLADTQAAQDKINERARAAEEHERINRAVQEMLNTI